MFLHKCLNEKCQELTFNLFEIHYQEGKEVKLYVMCANCKKVYQVKENPENEGWFLEAVRK